MASAAPTMVQGQVVKKNLLQRARDTGPAEKKGGTITRRLESQCLCRRSGIPLRPTELLVFGNPKLGSHLFTSRQTAGIDLPMKARAWEDEARQVGLGYNGPAYIARRHGIRDRDAVIARMRAGRIVPGFPSGEGS